MRASILLLGAVLLATSVDAKMGLSLWGCPKRNLVSVPWDSSMDQNTSYNLIYLDNFLNWMFNAAKAFTKVGDYTCGSVGSFGLSQNFYET